MPKQTKEEHPCIYGKELHEHCPVRAELGKRQKFDLSKWIKPKAKILEEADELIQRFTDALNYEYNALSNFCISCPFAEIYVEKRKLLG